MVPNVPRQEAVHMANRSNGVRMVDRDAVDTAARIAAGDDGKNYDSIAITLHWLTALLVLVQFSLGQTWDWFPRPTRHLMIVSHMSFGIILTLVLLARVLWRFVLRHQLASLETGFVRIASVAVHYVLYGLLATEAVLGFLSRWEGNEAMSFFGLQIPPPFTGSVKGSLISSRTFTTGWAGPSLSWRSAMLSPLSTITISSRIAYSGACSLRRAKIRVDRPKRVSAITRAALV